ncbi:putative diphthine synthase [Cardiosporidium cionae]|uniref:diphthine methyl ester synthase n=1 Tax=Cardiosporidium cionae TaxID=476202 RepID=A0ABQ7JBE2_9APIC|nr:putative diphthine synthase [Cardiosporidium cionae]|eukprot:KAF8821323.1 putative diphthine synthase [Cardiosporidium cionae]
MVLTLIGLGLADSRDISLKGYDATKAADYVYMESYTSCLIASKEELEECYGKNIIDADRDLVEMGCEVLLDRAESAKVVLLVVGDPLCATTHADIVLRAKRRGISVEIIHNASIMSAIGICGLDSKIELLLSIPFDQMYRFGETISIPFFENNWKPDSFYDRIKRNRDSNLHTLCLLDIKTKERSLENLMRDRRVYEPPRFMMIRQAIEQLFEIEHIRKENVCHESVKVFGVARVGTQTERIKSGTLHQLTKEEFGEALHSLIICAPQLHDVENEFYEYYCSNDVSRTGELDVITFRCYIYSTVKTGQDVPLPRPRPRPRPRPSPVGSLDPVIIIKTKTMGVVVCVRSE